MVCRVYSVGCPPSGRTSGWRQWPPPVLVGPLNRGHRIGPTRSRHLRRISQPRLPQSAPSVEFTEGFLSAPPENEAVIAMNDETRSPLSGLRNLRSRGPTVRRPPAVCLPTPHRTVGAHEENASECNSERGVARRSG